MIMVIVMVIRRPSYLSRAFGRMCEWRMDTKKRKRKLRKMVIMDETRQHNPFPPLFSISHTHMYLALIRLKNAMVALGSLNMSQGIAAMCACEELRTYIALGCSCEQRALGPAHVLGHQL